MQPRNDNRFINTNLLKKTLEQYRERALTERWETSTLPRPHNIPFSKMSEILLFKFLGYDERIFIQPVWKSWRKIEPRLSFYSVNVVCIVVQMIWWWIMMPRIMSRFDLPPLQTSRPLFHTLKFLGFTMSSKQQLIEQIIQAWHELQRQTPLVQCMTNSVANNYVANILLAAGASPAMIDNPFEAESFTQISSALVSMLEHRRLNKRRPC